MKKTVVFYTPEQNKILLKELFKGIPIKDIAKKYSKEWNKSYPALYIKVMKMKADPYRSSPNESTRKKIVKSGMELPKGFSLDILDVKRAIIHSNNSITLYF
jgi:hypothetical protein